MRSPRRTPTDRWRAARAVPVIVGAGLIAWLLSGPLVASAALPPGWVHDHSSAGIPPRPNGYSALVARFGQPCNANANAARSYWPSQSARNVPGYIYYNPYIDRDVSYNIRNHITADGKENAVDYGVWGYNCRLIDGTSSWSTHAFGAAVDTNSARNPVGQTTWNGIGSDGVRYKSYLPKLWKGASPGHNFYWGLQFSTTPDPMHFQYVTGY